MIPGLVMAEPAGRAAPRGLAKIAALNWPLVFLLCAVASAGFLMLYSVAGGKLDPWARPQMMRFVRYTPSARGRLPAFSASETQLV